MTPTVYDLPTISGVINREERKSFFYKTQEGLVGLYMCLIKKDGSSFQNGEVFATLPEGFRPAMHIAVSLMANEDNGALSNIGHIHVTYKGEIAATAFYGNSIDWVMSDTIVFPTAL